MRKVLIIDDDPIVSTVYQRLVEREGYVSMVANDGAQGLDRALKFEPDAVLLDLFMPTLNGFIVLKTIRAAFGKLPVIVLTSACTPEFREKAFAAGADQVLDKSKATPTDITACLQLALDGLIGNRWVLPEADTVSGRFSNDLFPPGP